jgi:hypothetical protein
MSPEENNEIVEDKFSLSELLTPDTPEVKEIKSLYEREYEYRMYLSEIEFSIARHYYEENRNLKDKDVISAVKNIKQNRDKPTRFFKKDLEKEIVESLIEPLEESPLTNHEFTLVLDYILWVVDNRSWIEDKQAYVKWITYVLGFLSEEEEGKYERQFKKLTRRAGLSAAQAEMLLMKREMTDDFFGKGKRFKGVADKTEILEKDITAEDLETGFFLMNDDEKFDFLLEKGPDYVEFVQSYVSELVDKGDFEKIQVFYKKFSEKHNDFFILHFIMGTAYIDKDPALAKSYFEEALKTAENYEEIPKEMIEDLRGNINLLTKLLMEESAGKTEEKTGESKKGKKGCKTGKKA